MDNLDLADRDRRMAYGPTLPPESRVDAGRVTDPASRVWPQAIAVVLVSTLIRLIIATLTPLFPDETYYWAWSRRLASGYFDHPPAIAWLIHAGTLIDRDTALGVRVGAVLVGGIATLFLCAAARRLAGNRAALLTAVAFAVMPLSAAGLILATPDAGEHWTRQDSHTLFNLYAVWFTDAGNGWNLGLSSALNTSTAAPSSDHHDVFAPRCSFCCAWIFR